MNKKNLILGVSLMANACFIGKGTLEHEKEINQGMILITETVIDVKRAVEDITSSKYIEYSNSFTDHSNLDNYEKTEQRDFFGNNYLKTLEISGFSERTKVLLNYILYNKLEGKKFSFFGEDMIFSEEFITDNHELLLKNLEDFFMFLIKMESSGDIYAENSNSSAKGPLQFIDGYKNGKKHKNFSRKKGKYTPYETALRRADMFFNEGHFTNFKSENTPKLIKEEWNNGAKIDIENLSPDFHIELFLMDFIMRRNKDIEVLFFGLLMGDKEKTEEIYNRFHHTSPDDAINSRLVSLLGIY